MSKKIANSKNIKQIKGIAATILLSAATFVAMANAEDYNTSYRYLILRLENGATIRTGRVGNLLFDDSYLKIDNGIHSINIPTDQISGWDYVSTDSLTVSVPAISASGRDLSFQLFDNEITVTGVPDGIPVTLFTMQGTLLQSSKITSDVYILNLSTLSKGTYILSAAGRSFKFAVK